jgi:hypothetical protein
MYIEQKINGILEKMGPSFEDGISFRLLAVADGAADVAMVVDPSACEECIVPDSILESILLKEIRKQLPMMRQVKVTRSSQEKGTHA